MQKKKVLVLLGHPDHDTTGCYLANRYEEGARAAGHEVRRVDLHDLTFDPILHKGYRAIQALEPDLLKLQEDFKWAEHIALFYPNWWCSMPALLKGLFDRFFIPGFAFRFNKESKLGGWQRLLKGRTARIVITLNTHPWIERILMGDFSNEIRRGIFWFAGIWPARVYAIGPVEKASPEKLTRWGDKVASLGRKAY